MGEEDDEEPFVPAFSLFDSLREREAAGAPAPGDAIAQVVFCHDDFVVDIRHLGPRASLRLPGGSVLEHESPGKLRAQLAAGVAGEVRRRGEIRPVDLLDGTGGSITMSLDTNATASLRLRPRDAVLLQFVPAASVPRGAIGPARPDRQNVAMAAAAVGIHFAILLILGMTPAASNAATQINEGRFAMIEMKDPLLEVPKEKPKPKKAEKIKEKPKPKQEQKPLPTPPPPTPMPRLPESLRKFVQRPRQSSVPVNPKASATANKVLSALGSIGAPSATSTAMTNLNAVPSAEGASGGYKVSGAIGAMGSGVHLAPAGSGVGRVETRGGSQFGQAGKVTAVAGGQVRGKVTKAPPREVVVQGELDRGEIAKVINAHFHEIQACYERRLIANHTAGGGKLILDWVIIPTGSVGMVKVKFSDLKDSQIAMCIQAAVRLWHFPQPRGGSVTVTYPFVFQQM